MIRRLLCFLLALVCFPYAAFAESVSVPESSGFVVSDLDAEDPEKPADYPPAEYEFTGKRLCAAYSSDTVIYSIESFTIDNALCLLTNRGDASFYNMMQSGATTLWEMWHNEESSNHPMFGAVAQYLFRYILGIRQPAAGAGFSEITIDPAPAQSLDWAEGSVVLGGQRVFVRVEHGKAVETKITPAQP